MNPPSDKYCRQRDDDSKYFRPKLDRIVVLRHLAALQWLIIYFFFPGFRGFFSAPTGPARGGGWGSREMRALTIEQLWALPRRVPFREANSKTHGRLNYGYYRRPGLQMM